MARQPLQPPPRTIATTGWWLFAFALLIALST